MAITKVTANLEKNSTDLKNIMENEYSGSLKAPPKPGQYYAEIIANDDAGNITVANKENSKDVSIQVEGWREPKINWKPTDRFNIEDYNRIKNNLVYLHEKAVQLYKNFEITDMGEDIETYIAYWNHEKFNLFEKNLEIINQNVFIQNFGSPQTFYPNGVFIKWDELNRIENATLSIKLMLDGQKNGIKRLGFRLGTFKEVKT